MLVHGHPIAQAKFGHTLLNGLPHFGRVRVGPLVRCHNVITQNGGNIQSYIRPMMEPCETPCGKALLVGSYPLLHAVPALDHEYAHTGLYNGMEDSIQVTRNQHFVAQNLSGGLGRSTAIALPGQQHW
jgi:hypothetical protein